MKKINLFVVVVLLASSTMAQNKSPKVVLITLDGLRWQEMFAGADPLLVGNAAYVHDTTALKKRFWRATPGDRREALMPFIWKEVSKMGQIHGNRNLGSKVDLTNKMWFSYPGYNEILSGKADDERINSNDKIPNPNMTVLEVANNDPRYKGKVAAFGSWDVFPFIINEKRSGVPVNGGYENATGNNLTQTEKTLNRIQRQAPIIWESVRLDVFTHNFAMEEMKKSHPEFMYISYGETDDFAHDGDYQAYLNSANNTDALIKELWDFTQGDPFYKDNTLFIVSTDHGRGTDPLENWKSHGSNIAGSGGVWLIFFGAAVAPNGEIKKEEQLYSNQIAPTIAKTLGLKGSSVSEKKKGFDVSKE